MPLLLGSVHLSNALQKPRVSYIAKSMLYPRFNRNRNPQVLMQKLLFI
jgi:hypothetical protein